MTVERRERLLRAVSARASAEAAKFAEIKRRRAALLDEAATYAARARALRLEESAANGAEIAAYARHLAHLARLAAEKRAAADALAPEESLRAATLARALGEEKAWSLLRDRAAAEKRAAAEQRAEEAREALTRAEAGGSSHSNPRKSNQSKSFP